MTELAKDVSGLVLFVFGLLVGVMVFVVIPYGIIVLVRRLLGMRPGFKDDELFMTSEQKERLSAKRRNWYMNLSDKRKEQWDRKLWRQVQLRRQAREQFFIGTYRTEILREEREEAEAREEVKRVEAEHQKEWGEYYAHRFIAQAPPGVSLALTAPLVASVVKWLCEQPAADVEWLRMQADKDGASYTQPLIAQAPEMKAVPFQRFVFASVVDWLSMQQEADVEWLRLQRPPPLH